jgi:plasmid stability protein
MESETVRATIYMDKNLHKAIRLKAADAHRSVSDVVADAIRDSLREDEEDLAIIAKRSKEKRLTYAEFVTKLKADGVL